MTGLSDVFENKYRFARNINEAKELISEYCVREFGDEPIDWSTMNLNDVGIAYSTFDLDDKEYDHLFYGDDPERYEVDVQVSVDLINLKTKVWSTFHGRTIYCEEKHKSYEEMGIDSWLDFDSWYEYGCDCIREAIVDSKPRKE